LGIPADPEDVAKRPRYASVPALCSKNCSAIVNGQSNGDNSATIPQTGRKDVERGQQCVASRPESSENDRVSKADDSEHQAGQAQFEKFNKSCSEFQSLQH